MNGLAPVAFDLSTIYMPSNALFRSISAENPTGEKGKGGMALPDPDGYARHLGQGWKASPFLTLKAGETATIADIAGPGMITHIWTTCGAAAYRDCIIRFYWDGESEPSVEVPYGDFFCNGWGVRANVVSIPVNVNPTGGFNCYWPMPFRQSCTITIENQRAADVRLFYQVDYLLTDVPEDSMYFHAQWRRANPLPLGEEYTIVDGVKGRGRYAGVYLAWGQNNNLWWGEGEVKFYWDGDGDFPTYCGTGLEDYFGGAWGFANNDQTARDTYSAPYLGYHQLIKPDGYKVANTRHGLYRWHIVDPVLFQHEFKATVQALGWRGNTGESAEYKQLQDDIASTAFWYQQEPHAPFPTLPDCRFREVV